MHILKTGGSSVDICLWKGLQARQYKHHLVPEIEENRVSGGTAVRNFSEKEMIAIAKDPSPLQYFKNHPPWSKKVFRRLKWKGWFVFSFVRHPGNLICSWYHYFGMSNRLWAHRSLEDCMTYWFSKPLYWLIPSYWQEMDYIREFSEVHVRDLLKNYLGLEFNSLPHARRSTNPGYDFYCRTGAISKATQRLVENHPQFRRYLEIKQLELKPTPSAS